MTRNQLRKWDLVNRLFFFFQGEAAGHKLKAYQHGSWIWSREVQALWRRDGCVVKGSKGSSPRSCPVRAALVSGYTYTMTRQREKDWAVFNAPVQENEWPHLKGYRNSDQVYMCSLALKTFLRTHNSHFIRTKTGWCQVFPQKDQPATLLPNVQWPSAARAFQWQHHIHSPKLTQAIASLYLPQLFSCLRMNHSIFSDQRQNDFKSNYSVMTMWKY